MCIHEECATRIPSPNSQDEFLFLTTGRKIVLQNVYDNNAGLSRDAATGSERCDRDFSSYRHHIRAVENIGIEMVLLTEANISET
jgi:hypothetical protein